MIFIGDTHGDNFEKISGFMRHNDIQNEIFIHVGDFGMGFRALIKDINELKHLNENLRTHNCKLYTIRGNHDNPDFWIKDMIPELKELSNIYFVPDFTVLNLEGSNILFVGGAISIDRKYRKARNMGYWENEGFPVLDFDKSSLVSDMKNIDMVVTHTSPSFTAPTTLSDIVHHYAANDHRLYIDLIAERQQVDYLYDLITEKNDIKVWCYGHFHFSNNEIIDGIKFKLLNIDEFYQINK